MQKDIALKQFMEHDDVFAEAFNVLACGGQQLLDEQTLREVAREAVTVDRDEVLREARRDVIKVDQQGGCYRLICDLENQYGVDNTMPERIMGYDYAAYEKQIRKIREENDKKNHKAYTKRIHGDQKLAPVLTMVLYWGSDDWDGPMRLHEMLAFPEGMDETIRGLVPDYPINLVSMKDLSEEVRSQLKTDLRPLADYMAMKKKPKECEALLTKNRQKILHPQEFRQAIVALGGGNYAENLMNTAEENKNENKEDVVVCEVMDKIFNDRYGERLKREVAEKVAEEVNKQVAEKTVELEKEYTERLAERLTERLAEETERVTEDVTEQVTEQVTRQVTRQGIQALVQGCKAFRATKEQVCAQVIQLFGVPEQEARLCVAKYW